MPKANVTIGGTSAGGASVGLQLRFRRQARASSIAQSFRAPIRRLDGPRMRSTCPRAIPWRPRSTAITRLFCWPACAARPRTKSCSPGRSRPSRSSHPQARIFWEPVVDGLVIPDQPRNLIARGLWERVSHGHGGANRDEGWGSFITQQLPERRVAQTSTSIGLPTSSAPTRPRCLPPIPPAEHVSPEEALARMLGDGQFVCEARRLARLDLGPVHRGVPASWYKYVIPDLSPGHVDHGFETNIIFGNTYSPPFPAHVLDAADKALPRRDGRLLDTFRRNRRAGRRR